MTAGCFKCHVFVVGVDSFLACHDVAFDLCLWCWYHQGFCPFLTEMWVVMLSDRNRSLCCFCSVCWAYGQKVCMDQWLLKGADRHRQTDARAVPPSTLCFLLFTRTRFVDLVLGICCQMYESHSVRQCFHCCCKQRTCFRNHSKPCFLVVCAVRFVKLWWKYKEDLHSNRLQKKFKRSLNELCLNWGIWVIVWFHSRTKYLRCCYSWQCSHKEKRGIQLCLHNKCSPSFAKYLLLGYHSIEKQFFTLFQLVRLSIDLLTTDSGATSAESQAGNLMFVVFSTTTRPFTISIKPLKQKQKIFSWTWWKRPHCLY